MNFKIKKEILTKHLNYAIKGISTKNLRPILNCIKFELTNEGLYLLSSDNDIAIKTFINKSYIEEDYTCGSFVVYGRYIYDIVRKMPDEIISFEEVIDSKLFISTTNSSFTLNCNNVSDFPNLELEEIKEPIILSTKLLKNIVNQTSFSASNQESRPVLTGINIKIKDDTLECTATDSYRLSKKIIKLEEKVENDVNIIIPTKNIIELTKMFDEENEDLEIHIFSNKIIFKFGTIIMLSRLIEGNYPDTNTFINNEVNISFNVDCHDFYSLLDRVSLLSIEEEKNTIKLETESNLAIVSSNIPEIGNVLEKIEIEKNIDADIKIAFSSKYMMDAIKSLECEKINLSFNCETKPIIIRNCDDDSLIQVISPIRTY
jgi:DNA polymerase-3 subunit beta